MHRVVAALVDRAAIPSFGLQNSEDLTLQIRHEELLTVSESADTLHCERTHTTRKTSVRHRGPCPGNPSSFERENSYDCHRAVE